MARKYTERYVRYYTFGSTAAKLDQQRKVELPKYQKTPKKRKPIAVDPVAFTGSAVAVLLAVLMLVGFVQVAFAQAQVHELQTQATILEQERQMLQEIYEEGYDLDEIRIAAQSMGMVEAADAVHVRVNVPEGTQEVQRLGWWESLMLSLREFFA